MPDTTETQEATREIAAGLAPPITGVALESVLFTDELKRRPSRQPDHKAESRALLDLARHLADSPTTILQKLVNVALETLGAGSAGVSLISKETGDFYWPAIAGAWNPQVGGGTPRHFGPCAVVLATDACQLFNHPERCYSYLAAARPVIEEVLLSPFHVRGEAVGTVWVVSHDPSRRFDAEDQRLLVSLSTFASAAYQTLESLDELERQRVEIDDSAARPRDFAEATLRTSPVPLVVLESDLRVVTANEAFYTRFHMAPEQTEGRLFYELGNEQWDIPKLRRLLEEFLPRHHSFEDFEVTHEFEQIGTRTMMLNARRMEVEDGGPERIVLVIEDITERKRAEEALRESEMRFRTLFELGPVAVYSCDTSGVIKDFNRRAAELWGRTPARGDTDERFCGSFRMLRPDGTFMPHECCPMADVLSGTLPLVQDGEVHIERPDGSRVIVIVSIRPLKNEHGEITGAINCFYDITDRKRAEEALRDSEARFRMLADNMSQLAWTCDTLGNTTWYNQRWLDYTGMSFDEMKGWDWSKVQHPDHLARVVAGVKHSAETGEPWDDTFPLRGKDGEYRWFLSRALPIRDAAGRIDCWFGTNTDVTRQREIENALDQARDAAENASRAKDRFLAVLSHELRMPLTPVLMTVAAMDMNPDLAPALRGDIAMIRRNVELEAKLIDDLLDLSRITAGKLRLNMDAVDVNSAVRHVCETCRPLILEKAIHLHCELPHEPAFVTADPARLQQIMWNLLKNATKFTQERGDVYVTVSTLEDRRVRMEVRDTGIGIPPEAISKIFDAFEQGDANVTKQFGGMGLGLAISRALVEVHGGSIRAHSDGSERGSTFTVELPLLAPEHIPPPRGVPFNDNGDKGQLRVLVVEDHRDTAEVLRRLLQASGHQVKTAYSAAAALELAGKEPFDVLVSDIGLPDSTGYELMKQIRARYAIKGIAMSGYGMEEDLRKSREAGFSDHIVKPANVAQLERSIRRVAEGALPEWS